MQTNSFKKLDKLETKTRNLQKTRKNQKVHKATVAKTQGELE